MCKIRYFVIALFGLYLLCGCEDALTVKPENSLTDENGVLAAEDLEITAEVIGGTLLGLENGDLADLTPYCESHRKTHNGRLIVYVKPKEDVKVCISCPALDKRVWIE